MLVSALGATLVGFALLVLALATGTLWLAIACIAICVAGALLLLADTLGLRPSLPRRSRTPEPAGEGSPSTPADDDAPTEQFERITEDTVVTLGDDEPESAPDAAQRHVEPAASSSRHGRHERPDLDEEAVGDEAVDGTTADEASAESTRRGRHGTSE